MDASAATTAGDRGQAERLIREQLRGTSLADALVVERREAARREDAVSLEGAAAFPADPSSSRQIR